MTEIEVFEAIKSYECSHAVEDYVFDGWHVWPLLRTIIGLRQLPKAPKRSPLPATLRNPARLLRKWLVHWLSAFGNDDAPHDDPYDAQRDAVILTPSGRRVLVNGAYYEIFSEPLVEILHGLDFSTLIWEHGNKIYPRHSKSAWISCRLEAESYLASFKVYNSAPEPSWFVDFQGLASTTTGRKVLWTEIFARIDNVTRKAAVFEAWLRKTGARYLFTVCWYDPLAMAATLAARRCGIKSIEIQHGAQGNHHFAYSSWQRAPDAGYEVLPDVFLLWGNEFATDIRKYNPAFASKPATAVVGNLWLNHWRSRSIAPGAPPLTGEPKHQKNILVSLQLDIEPVLIETIAASPESWRWNLRFHPQRANTERERDKQKILQTGHPGIDFDHANNSLLYELFLETDIHVTECSTCALEALAFGVPSVIVNAIGRAYFLAFIDAGLMHFSTTGSDIISTIERNQKLDVLCPQIINLFATGDETQMVLKSLISSKQDEIL